MKLNSGFNIPVVGLGTWLSKPGEVAQAVKDAIDVGYRHIDCAFCYNNQEEIGEALEAVFSSGKVKREDIFITSKIWNTFHSFDECKRNVDIILKQLRLSYVDLMLIHWPHGFEECTDVFPKNDDGTIRYSDVDYLETWRGLEACVKEGKIRSIGLSNFNSEQIQRIIDNGTITPAMNQVECHPYFPQNKLKAFCEERGIRLAAYSPLTNPGSIFRQDSQPFVLNDDVVKKIAETTKKTPAQVVIRWAVQRGTVVLPKSVSRYRIEENINVFDFELSPEQMAAIKGIDRNYRFAVLERDQAHKYYPFAVEF